MFFDSWYDLFRIVIVGTCAYAGLIFCLRVSGKRTLSKMNAFDLVITVAFGSTFASALLTGDVSLAEAITAFALLCALQFVVAKLSVRYPRFQSLIKAEPALLYRGGEFLESAMRRERVTREEIVAAMRSTGSVAPSDVAAVILETDGSFSVIAGTDKSDIGTLRYVRGASI